MENVATPVAEVVPETNHGVGTPTAETAVLEPVSKEPGVQAAKSLKTGDIITLNSGFRVKLCVMPDMLMQRAMAAVKDPPVPMFYNEEKGREEENEADPDYQVALEEARSRRGQVAADVAVVFGVDLLDEIPPPEKWAHKLRMVGLDVDINDPVEVQYAFIRYIVFASSSDVDMIIKRQRVTEEDVAAAAAVFRSANSGSANPGGNATE